MSYNCRYLNTQNDLLLNHLLQFYAVESHLRQLLSIIRGDTTISLRIVDWFVTNYAKKHYVVYPLKGNRFKVYNDYKLKLKAYSKRRFDPFQRWERIEIPIPPTMVQEVEQTGSELETTIGQLNFFKWAIENDILAYIEANYAHIEEDMNQRNSSSKKRLTCDSTSTESTVDNKTTRKKREELSVSATKCIKKESVKIVVKFS